MTEPNSPLETQPGQPQTPETPATETPETPAAPHEPATNANSAESPTSSVGIIVGVVVVALVLIGGLYWLSMSGTGDSNSLDMAGLDDLAATNPAGGDTAPALDELPDTVAEVNGVAISKETFEQSIAQTEAALAQQGADPSDPAMAQQLFDQALERAINNELLAQAAADADIAADPAAVEAELASIRGQFPDEATFAAELETAELTLAELREDIAMQLTLDAYLTNTEAVANVPPVTEAEARALYDQAVAQAGEGAPSFAEVQPQIQAQILQQKQQEAIAQVIEALRAEAEIEVLI